MAYGPQDPMDNPVSTSPDQTPYSTAGLVLGALVALVLIARGFRGVNVGGVSVGVK
jgi:hypothetical protein